MKRINFSKVTRNSLPADKPPLLTEAQKDALKTASAVALALIASAGIITLSAIAPNAFVAIDKLFLRKHSRKLSRKETEQKVTRTFFYLKEHGLIKMKQTGDDYQLILTSRGKRKLQEMNFENLQVAKPKSWNGKWWQVAADIPTEEHKAEADLFREKLKGMGFFSLQRTLWLYPHDPRQEIEMVTDYYEISHFATVMEINRLDEDDEFVMEKFFRKTGKL